jgi:5-methylcytosine-specific restriction endonuclease McrA
MSDEQRVANVQSAIRFYDERSGKHIVRDAYGDAPCVYCGGAQESRDHVVPVSRGGLHTRANMVPACHRCNHLKSDQLPDVFFERHPKFAWRFARQAVHANPVYLEMARGYGRSYETKALFEVVEEEEDA